MQWSNTKVSSSESSDGLHRVKVETQIDANVIFQVAPDGTIRLVPIAHRVQSHSSASARTL
jgi:hypothetical protein